MPFPLPPVLIANNDKRSLTYGLRYLQTDQRTLLQNRITRYENCEVLASGIVSLSKEDYEKRIQAACQEVMDHNNWTAVNQLVQFELAEQRKTNTYYWYKEWQKALQQDAFWQKCALSTKIANDAAKLTELKHLQQAWQRHGQFAHFTAPVLLYAAELLADIELSLKAAFLEFQQQSEQLPVMHRQQYQTYFEEAFKYIAIEKQALTQSMFARLQLMWQNLQFNQDDVVVDIIQKLKALGALKPTTSLDKQRPASEFQAKTIKAFHAYINVKGSAELKTQLNNLLTIAHQPTILIMGKQTPNHYLLLPQTLAKYVPNSPKKPAWLFKGHQWRYEFFVNKTALLLKLSRLAQLQIPFKNRQSLSKDVTWQELAAIQEWLIKEQAFLKKPFVGWKSLFRQKSQQLGAEWKQFLCQQQQALLQKQMMLLEQWVAAPPIVHLFNRWAYTPEERQALRASIHQLEKGMAFYATERDREHFITLKRKVINQLARDQQFHEAYLNAEDYLRHLAKHEGIADEHYHHLINYYLKLNVEQQGAFYQVHQMEFAQINQQFTTFLQSSVQQQLAFIADAKKIKPLMQYQQLLGHLKDTTINNNVQLFLSITLKEYQQYLTTVVNENAIHQDQLIAYEAMLEKWVTAEQMVDLIQAKLQRQALMAPAKQTGELTQPLSQPIVSDMAVTLAQKRQVFAERCQQQVEDRLTLQTLTQKNEQVLIAAQQQLINSEQLNEVCLLTNAKIQQHSKSNIMSLENQVKDQFKKLTFQVNPSISTSPFPSCSM